MEQRVFRFLQLKTWKWELNELMILAIWIFEIVLSERFLNIFWCIQNNFDDQFEQKCSSHALLECTCTGTYRQLHIMQAHTNAYNVHSHTIRHIELIQQNGWNGHEIILQFANKEKQISINFVRYGEFLPMRKDCVDRNGIALKF